MAKEAWKTATVRILDALKPKDTSTILLSSGKVVNFSALKYTVLDQKNVYRDSQELAELHQLTQELPKNLISFRPHRLALHEVISAVTTRIQCKSDNSLNSDDALHQVVHQVYSGAKPAIDEAEKKLDDQRLEIEKEITEIVGKLMSHESIPEQDKPVYFDDVLKCFHELSKKEVKVGEFKDGYTLEKAIIARAADIVFNKIAKTEMEKIINSHIDDLIQQKTLTPLDIPDSSERQTFMVAGGQASGKGSSVAQLQYCAEEAGIQWENVAKINTDSYKPLLLEPDSVEPELYSQLAQEEASLVNARTQEKLKKLAESNQAPHVLFDQVFVGPDQLKIAKVNQGETKIMIVSTEVTDAVERSYARGMHTGRFENTMGVLNCHKNMTKQLPDRISEMQNEKVTMRIVDNNVNKNEQPTPVADIDCQTKNIIVYDTQKLERFIAKVTINPNALSAEEIYDSKQTQTIDQYFANTKYNIVQYSTKIDQPELETKEVNRPVA